MADETFLIRCTDGPASGDRMLDPDAQRLLGLSWPLPDRLDHAGGYYRKVGESQLSEAVPGVVRGAQYEWVPEGQPALPERCGVCHGVGWTICTDGPRVVCFACHGTGLKGETDG